MFLKRVCKLQFDDNRKSQTRGGILEKKLGSETRNISVTQLVSFPCGSQGVHGMPCAMSGAVLPGIAPPESLIF